MTRLDKDRDESRAWAAPTEQDIRAWESLPRDEQLRRLQELLSRPESNDISELSFDDVIARAKSRRRVMTNV